MLAGNVPDWVAHGLLRHYAEAATHPAKVSPAVAEITGEPPRTFARWVADHAADFRGVVHPTAGEAGR